MSISSGKFSLYCLKGKKERKGCSILIPIREMQIKSITSLTLPQTEGTSSKCLQTIPTRIAEILVEYRNWRKYELVMMAITNRRKGPLNLQTDIPYYWTILYFIVYMGKSYIEKTHPHICSLQHCLQSSRHESKKMFILCILEKDVVFNMYFEILFSLKKVGIMPISVTFRVEVRLKVNAVSEKKTVNSIYYHLLLKSQN